MVYLALQNVPKGVPARVHLDETPLSVAWTQTMWRTALQRTQGARRQRTGVQAVCGA